MQSHGFSNQAYLYTGLAVQIACSLGLHCDKYCASYGGVEKEQARRVWWSLIVFDQDLSLRLGKPFATKESWCPPLPSEVILPSGAYSPPEYLAACKELSLLVSITQKRLYKDPFVLHHEIEINALLEILASLTQWSDNLPPHLRLLVPTAPLHRRPISLLHLRYHGSRLLIARPFLLYQLLFQANGPETPKSSSLDTFSAICLTSAEQMLAILQSMVNDGIHSKLIAMDFYYALDILHIFLASFALTADQKQFDNIYRCLKILQAMGTTGFGERMLPEVLFELIEWGIFPYQLDNRADGHMEAQQNLQNCLQDLDESLSNGDAPSEIHDWYAVPPKLTSRQKPSGIFSLDVPLDFPSEEVMGEILCPSVE
ncbi:hypothetical protein N7466_007957 [Penicillium verhagenii]|uniref:uncharacterized protein n=1 Tax=Penicillium verhagenii TaxID=1562060 RepID=UPI00254561F3|nr:uncharacterized protein N7466_007957 [Penicillium verhagenii]KAJ5929001.1 hypothetical protein N7466_007957 [Penicillium verhagenii]